MKAGLLRQKEMEDIIAFQDLITMKRVVGKDFVRWIYCIGALLLSLATICVTIWGLAEDLSWVAILAVAFGIAGNLAWRLSLEWWILFYSMNAKLTSIDKALKESAELPPVSTP